MKTYISNEELKTEDGQKRMVKSIIQAAGGIDRGLKRDEACYQIYSGEINDDKFSYLTKIGENSMPAKMRWFPAITARLNKLISQEAQRLVKSTVYCSDQRSVEEKQLKKSQRLFTMAKRKISSFNEQLIFQQGRISKAKQRLNQLQQQAEKNNGENSEAAKLDEMVPLIDLKLNQLLSNVGVDMFVNQKEKDEVDRYMMYDDKDVVEQGYQGALNEAIKKQNIPFKKVSGFRDKMITGKELYFVDWKPGMPNPRFEQQSVNGVNWSNEESAIFVQECRWATIEKDVSLNDIFIRFGDDLSVEAIGDLARFSGADIQNNGHVAVTPNWGAVFVDKARPGSYKAIGGKNVSLTTVYWKQLRNAVWKENTNSDGNTFYHVVDEEYKPKKTETIQKRYVEDLWVGHVINGKHYVGIKKHPVQLRDLEDPSRVQLPLIGYAFNNPAIKPYSLIWETRDIQESISIMAYHRELLFAISGVKGIVMDMSQKPDISDEEWMLDFKQGIAWIESMKSGRGATFNQFQTYDNTVSPAVGMISDIILHLEDSIGMVTGITRESMGNTKGTDQVGTYEMATRASNVVTYILFYEHDILMKEALTRFINLGRLAWKDGKQGTYFTDDIARKVFKIYPDMATNKYFDIMLTDSIKENEKLERLMAVAIQARNNREISLSNLVSIIDSDNVKDIQKKVEFYSDKMAEIAQSNAMSVEQKKAEVQMQGIKLQAEYDMMVRNSEMELEKVKLMLEKAKVELERTSVFVDAQLRREDIKSKEQISDQKVRTEAAVEIAYLNEEKLMHRTDETLRHAEIGIEALSAIGNLMVSDKKADIDKTKAKSQGMGKERIKDTRN